MKNFSVVLIAVCVCIGVGIFSYTVFSKSIKSSKTLISPSASVVNGQTVFNNSAPRTQACPLNGQLYSSAQQQWWSKHRPLGVMIENEIDARPQSGLSSADVVYEAVAEGGITRFLAIFYCQDAGEIGPIRSARTYFIDFASEYGNSPLYAHVGGANQPGPANALGQLTTYGWTGYNDLNQFSIGYPVFWRDYSRQGHTVATEHTMYSTTDKLLAYAASNRGLTNVNNNGTSWTKGFVPYKFKADAPVSQRPASESIHLTFWGDQPDYFVTWKYDPATNMYLRFNGGVASKDVDNGKQLSAKDIIVLKMVESSANDGYPDNVHLLYQDKGTGKALVFEDGKEIQATWQKNSRTSRTLLFNSSGSQIQFDRGTMWFEILPTYSVVTVN